LAAQCAEASASMLLDRKTADKIRDELRHSLMHGMSGVRGRRSRLAFPPTLLPELAGPDLTFWAPLALAAYEGLKNVVYPHSRIQLGDIRVYLQDETDAAYDFLSRQEAAVLWSHCNRGLVESIRGWRAKKWVIEPKVEHVSPSEPPRLRFDSGAIGVHRDSLRGAIRALHDEPQHFQVACDAEYASTAVLAWAIIVESALLNDRLMEDMRTVAREKGTHCMLQEGEWRMFYLPKPYPEDRPLSIPVANPKPSGTKSSGSGFAWHQPGPYGAVVLRKLRPCASAGKKRGSSGAEKTCTAKLVLDGGNAPPSTLEIVPPEDLKTLWSVKPVRGKHLPMPRSGWLAVSVTLTKKDGSTESWLHPESFQLDSENGRFSAGKDSGTELWAHVQGEVSRRIGLSEELKEIACGGIVLFDQWPTVKLDAPLKITIVPAPTFAECAPCAGSAKIVRLPLPAPASGRSLGQREPAAYPGLPCLPADATSSGQ